jgi:hypothetical protein
MCVAKPCGQTDGISEISEESSISETTVSMYQNAKHHIPEGCDHESYHHENPNLTQNVFLSISVMYVFSLVFCLFL